MPHRPQVGRFTLKNAFSSMRLASIRKMAYISRQMRPTFLSSLNLFRAKATYNISRDDRSEMALYSIPAEFIPTYIKKGKFYSIILFECAVDKGGMFIYFLLGNILGKCSAMNQRLFVTTINNWC